METKSAMRRFSREGRMNNDPFQRIQTHGAGTGEFSEVDIERRAREIAQTDGRSEPGEHDRVRAIEDLGHPGPPASPEADESESPVGSWSKGPASRPHEGVHVSPDDEQMAVERLVEQGVEEDDHDLRVSATEHPPSERNEH